MAGTILQPQTIAETQAAVRESARVLPRGGGSKTALSTPFPARPGCAVGAGVGGETAGDGAAVLDLSALAGVVEYEPAEFTFTALAGTRVADVSDLLARNGQYLPFDPPLAAHGATLGGSVAAGLSGPERYRYGGVRDFILGVRYVDGEGQVVHAGGRVVKNSAGFDIPKLMVGSLGTLGALIELTFKVFPRPEAYGTLRLACARLEEALAALYRLLGSQLEINALDLEGALPPKPGDPAAGAVLWIRLGGQANALPARIERLRSLLGGGEAVNGETETGFWRDAREFAWVPDGWSLVKVPLTPRRIPDLENLGLVDPRQQPAGSLAGFACLRRYSAGGQVAWIATPAPLEALDVSLKTLDLPGLVLLGPAGRARLGATGSGEAFERRVKAALDPAGRFAQP